MSLNLENLTSSQIIDNKTSNLSNIKNEIKQQTASSTNQKSEVSKAYTLDTSGFGPDNKAYQGQNMTTEDLMQAASANDVATQRDYMTVMSSSMSEEDFSKLQEEGYNPGDTEIKKAVTIIDKIKVTLAQSGVDIKGYNDNLDVKTLKEVTGNAGLAEKIASSLQQADAAVTPETVADAASAYKKADELTGISEGAKKYLVTNNKEASIDQVYMAQYSAASSQTKQTKGYYADEMPGYYAKKADNYNWQQLQPQMEKVIQDAGSEVNEDTLTEAKWVIEKGIPLTTSTFSSLDTLNSISFPLNQDTVLASIASSIADGKSASEALLNNSTGLAEQAANIVTDVSNITDEAVDETVSKNQPLNIRNLKKAMQSILAAMSAKNSTQTTTAQTASKNESSATTKKAGATQTSTAAQTLGTIQTSTAAQTAVIAQTLVAQVSGSSDTSVAEDNLSTITAKRQLAEIRLTMTAGANYTLLKSGYSIETTDLAKLVEDLKAVEKQQKQILFGTDSDTELEKLSDEYEETLGKIKEIPTLPAAVLGKIQYDSSSATTATESSVSLTSSTSSFTLNNIYTQGTILKSTYAAANQTYEALMTAPRSDLGDSIKKAFRNVDDLLDNVNMDTTEANRKAVRILGYNQMEINQENIETVKSAELTVNSVVEKMTPAATLQLIRDGKNPLNMDMEELDTYLSDSTTEEETEKYSKFLYKLEKNSDITPEEKKSYVGIYRLFRQIEKSDGAAVGSLINQGAQVNLKNLLSAVRSNNAKGMDYSVDDDFGGITNTVASSTASISDQINSAFTNSYEEKLAKQVYSSLEPEKLKNISLTEDTTLEQFAQALNNQEVNQQQEQEYNQSNLEDIRSIREIDDTTLQTLLNYNIPVTANNLLSADYLMNNRGDAFKKIFNLAETTDSENAGDVDEEEENTETQSSLSLEDQLNQAMYKLHNSMTDEVSAKSAYENMKKTTDVVLSQAADSEGVTAIDLKAIALSHKQISFANQMAKEENYEIPLKINNEITSINLKIVHADLDSDETGKVTCTLETDKLGSVAAQFTCKDNQVTGYIAGTSKSGIDELKQMEGRLYEELTTESRNVSELQFVYSKNLNINNFSSNISQTKTSSFSLNMGNALQKEDIPSDKTDMGGSGDTTSQITDSNNSSLQNNSDSESEINAVSTKELYEIAKAFIIAIQNL